MAEKKKVEENVEGKAKSLEDSIAEALKAPKKRKFSQSWDLIINIMGLDLKKPENRFNQDFILPEGRGKDVRVVVFSATITPDAKKVADEVITMEELEAIAGSKAKIKKLVNDNDKFLAEATLMPFIGKALGPVLAPRGKMPKPLPPKAKPDGPVLTARKSVRMTLKDSPVIHVTVGTDKMKPEAVAVNADAAYRFVRDRMPRGKTNIKSVYLKLTMGKPIKVEMT